LPIYEYRCAQCDHQYERKEGFDAPAEQACPECSGQAGRILHAPGIVFKGPGFYITDNRRDDGRGSEKDGEKEKPSTEETSEVSAKT
jgi:putative FmdB family regulatory protein